MICGSDEERHVSISMLCCAAVGLANWLPCKELMLATEASCMWVPVLVLAGSPQNNLQTYTTQRIKTVLATLPCALFYNCAITYTPLCFSLRRFFAFCHQREKMIKWFRFPALHTLIGSTRDNVTSPNSLLAHWLATILVTGQDKRLWQFFL